MRLYLPTIVSFYFTLVTIFLHHIWMNFHSNIWYIMVILLSIFLPDRHLIVPLMYLWYRSWFIFIFSVYLCDSTFCCCCTSCRSSPSLAKLFCTPFYCVYRERLAYTIGFSCHKFRTRAGRLGTILYSTQIQAKFYDLVMGNFFLQLNFLMVYLIQWFI